MNLYDFIVLAGNVTGLKQCRDRVGPCYQHRRRYRSSIYRRFTFFGENGGELASKNRVKGWVLIEIL